MSRADIADLLGEEAPKPQINHTMSKGARQLALERKRKAIAIADSAARIMMGIKRERLKKSIEDLLMGNEAKKSKKAKSEDNVDDLMGDAPAASKKSDKKAAKAEKKADKKADKAEKKAEKKASKKAEQSDGDRRQRGAGKFYFPVGSDEREELKKRVVKSVKGEITTVELAKKLEVDSWKVRLVAVELAGEKAIKLKKDGSRTAVAPK